MSNFDEFKKVARDTAETIADKSVEFYKFAEEKTKIIAKITRLKTEIALEKNNIRKKYLEIGKKYYELYKDDPAEELKDFCVDITEATDRIELKKKQIEDIKTVASDDFDDIEVEIVIEETEDHPDDMTDDI